MNKSKEKISPKSNIEYTKNCKHCGFDLPERNVKLLPKKYLQEKLCYWGGIERPYLQIFKITCANPNCSKQYSVKIKKMDWLYK